MSLPQLKGKLEHNYPLKKLNTWKIGGTAEMVFWPETTDVLIQAVAWCRNNQTPVYFLGRGSNVLFPDGRLKGVVIVNTQLKKISWEKDLVQVEAGYSLMRLAREAAEKGLSGLEFAGGIPGTVGAAIAINAGAHGGQIGDRIEKIKVLIPNGEVLDLDQREIKFGYRETSLQEKGYFVLEGTLRLITGQDRHVIKETMDHFLAKRRITQPLDYPNAGSVFRNPPGDSAARLIEEAGWKGRSEGDAQVSEKHANFIVNKGEAKAGDVLRLIRDIQEDVRIKYGVELKTEIRMITG